MAALQGHRADDSDPPGCARAGHGLLRQLDHHGIDQVGFGASAGVDVEGVREGADRQAQQQLGIEAEELSGRAPDADDSTLAIQGQLEAALVQGLQAV